MYYFFHVVLALQPTDSKRPLILVGTFQSLDRIVSQLRGVLVYAEEEPTEQTQKGVSIIIREGTIDIGCDMPVTDEMGTEFIFYDVSIDVNNCLLGKGPLGQCFITPISVPTGMADLYFSLHMPTGAFANSLLHTKLSHLNLSRNTQAGYYREQDKIRKVLEKMERCFPTLGCIFDQQLTQAQFRAELLGNTCISMETAIYVIDALVDNGYHFHSPM